jgi:hypothetical protein
MVGLQLKMAQLLLLLLLLWLQAVTHRAAAPALR